MLQMRVDCVITNTRQGPVELVDTSTEDCQRDFTCQDNNTGNTTTVTCDGTKTIYNYKQNVSYDWSCVMYSDGCVYRYSYTENTTNTWSEEGACAMPGGRSCCPDGTSPVPEDGDLPYPPGWQPPTNVGPDEPNPFR